MTIIIAIQNGTCLIGRAQANNIYVATYFIIQRVHTYLDIRILLNFWVEVHFELASGHQNSYHFISIAIQHACTVDDIDNTCT